MEQRFYETDAKQINKKLRGYKLLSCETDSCDDTELVFVNKKGERRSLIIGSDGILLSQKY